MGQAIGKEATTGHAPGEETTMGLIRGWRGHDSGVGRYFLKLIK